MFVKDYVNQILAYKLIDTSSITSVLSAKFCNCIKDSKCNVECKDNEICGIMNNCVKILGLCTLPIKFCNARKSRPHMKVEHFFHIVEGMSVVC